MGEAPDSKGGMRMVRIVDVDAALPEPVRDRRSARNVSLWGRIMQSSPGLGEGTGTSLLSLTLQEGGPLHLLCSNLLTC